MIEDTKDKIRRNLVVYCGAILVGWYLGIDAQSFISVTGVEIKSIDPFKTTLLSLVALLYLTARFNFSEEYKVGGGYKAHFKDLPYDLVLNFVKGAIADYNKNGRNSKGCQVFDWAGFDLNIAEFIKRSPRYQNAPIDVAFGDFGPAATDHVGVVEISCMSMGYNIRTDLIAPGIPTTMKYKIPKRAVYRMRTRAFWRMVMADEKFLSAKLPMLMAVVTYVYLMAKLALIALGR